MKMKRTTLFLLLVFTACLAVGCSNIQVQQDVAEQNEVNVNQAAEDVVTMADLLDRAAKGDETWKEEWDDPNTTDPDLKGAIRGSITANIAGWKKTAKEIVEIAKLSE
jgi:hypothetical protein